MRATSASKRTMRTSLGLSESSINSHNTAQIPQSRSGSKGHTDIVISDAVNKLTQENQYLKMRLEQSKVLLRDITNAAKVNSSQLELMKTYKERHEAMVQRLSEVENAYISETAQLQKMVSENEALRRQVGELSVANNTYCAALSDVKGMQGEVVKAYKKVASSGIGVNTSASGICPSLKKDIRRQLAANIESSFMMLFSKADLSTSHYDASAKKRPRSSSMVASSQAKKSKSKSKNSTRSSSQATQKSRSSSKASKKISTSTRAHGNSSETNNSLEVNAGLIKKLQSKVDRSIVEDNEEKAPSPALFPMSSTSGKQSEIMRSKALGSSIVTKDNSMTGSTQANSTDTRDSQSSATLSVSTSTAHSSPAVPFNRSIGGSRASKLHAADAGVKDIYSSKISDNGDTSTSKRRTSVGQEDKSPSPRIAGQTRPSTITIGTPDHVPEFYRQHIRTVTEPLLQTIESLENENETLKAVIEGKDREISFLKKMLADMYIKIKEPTIESAEGTFTSTNATSSTTNKALLSDSRDAPDHYISSLSETASSFGQGKASKVTTPGEICMGSGLNLSVNSLGATAVQKTPTGRKDPVIASSMDYALINDMEGVIGMSKDVEKLHRKVAVETPKQKKS